MPKEEYITVLKVWLDEYLNLTGIYSQLSIIGLMLVVFGRTSLGFCKVKFLMKTLSSLPRSFVL